MSASRRTRKTAPLQRCNEMRDASQKAYVMTYVVRAWWGERFLKTNKNLLGGVGCAGLGRVLHVAVPVPPLYSLRETSGPREGLPSV